MMRLGWPHLAVKVLVLLADDTGLVGALCGCSLVTYPGLVDVSWWAMLHIVVWEALGGPLLWCQGIKSPVVSPMRGARRDICD